MGNDTDTDTDLDHRAPNPVIDHGMTNRIVFEPTHVHIKSGGVYDLLCVGECEYDGKMMATYWDYHGRIWIRPWDEFNDPKRFREVTPDEYKGVKKAMKLGLGNFMCLRPNHEFHARKHDRIIPREVAKTSSIVYLMGLIKEEGGDGRQNWADSGVA